MIGELTDVHVHRVVTAEITRLYSTHRHLIWEMAKRDLRDRFAGHFFGVIWAMGHPLFLMALYVMVFAYIFPVRLGSDAALSDDFTIQLLAGLIPWMTFQEVLATGATVVRSHASLVKQIVFPVEVLPVKSVIASTASQLVSTAFLVVYAAIQGALAPTILLWPILFGSQLLAMFGASYLLSSVGVFFKDVKDIVVIFCAANLFLQPILYLPNHVPRVLHGIFYANPFSYITWCYQDVFYYGNLSHPWAWVVFPAGSIGLFYAGFRLFRRMKVSFGDVL